MQYVFHPGFYNINSSILVLGGNGWKHATYKYLDFDNVERGILAHGVRGGVHNGQKLGL